MLVLIIAQVATPAIQPYEERRNDENHLLRDGFHYTRNYDEVLEQWRLITKDKQAAIVVLDMPLLDTRQGRDLTGVLIADIVLQLLSYVAQTEREFNRQRQAEGIAAAKARGVHFGPNFKNRGENYDTIKAAWERGELSGREAARQLGVAHGTFQRWCRE